MAMMWQLIDRWTALDMGMKHFFNGKPCRNFGNVWLRNTNRGKCVCPDCKKQRREKSYSYVTEEKKAEKREKMKKYVEENKEHVLKVRKDHRQRNKNWGIKKVDTEAQKASRKEWQEKNRNKILASMMNNRVRKKYPELFPEYWDEMNEFVLFESFALVIQRKEVTGIEWSVDHMVPLGKGGMHSWDNFQVIPRTINILKKDRAIFTQPHEWILKLAAFV